MKDHVPAVQPDPFDGNTLFRQTRGQGHHLFRPLFGVIGINKQNNIIRLAFSKMLKGQGFRIMSLDKGMSHGAENRNAVHFTGKHRGGAAKSCQITGPGCKKSGFGAVGSAQAKINQ